MSKLPLNLSLTFILLLIIGTAVLAQEKYVLSGYIKEEKTGETLIGAAVAVVEQPGLGTVTNTYGYYSIELNEGAHTL
ncbi:MAG: carboxypeptidase-like regulatory domain-containing protein, partial [Mameliella sp.]|nr:carboxypeptidase-like regulatory domain-containing protein [Phaeodactylibacter sp.]